MKNSFLIPQNYKISVSFLSWVGRSPRHFEGLCKNQEMPHQPRAWSEVFSTDCPSPCASKPAICSTCPKVRGNINKKRNNYFCKMNNFLQKPMKKTFLITPQQRKHSGGKQWVLFFWPGAGRGCIQTWALSSSQRRALITLLLAACGKGTNGLLWPNTLFCPYKHPSFSLFHKRRMKKKKGKRKKGEGKRFVQFLHILVKDSWAWSE